MKTSPQLETSPVKELVRAGHELAAAMGADTPIIEIAKLVSRLATALDVQLARANALASLVSVPDEIEPDDGNTFDYVDGWNACRAAMLLPISQTENGK